MIKQIFIPFYLGLGGPIASGKQPMPWIHVDDITRIFIHAVKNDAVSGVLNGVAPQVNVARKTERDFYFVWSID